MKRFVPVLAALGALSLVASFATVLRAEEPADFPPGVFTDGGRYSLEDLKGKVVVLFFFEETCPRCRGLVPERNKMIQALKDKPVVFLAIDPGHPLSDSAEYAKETKLAMPIFADPLRLMEARWKEHISLNNVYQFKIINQEGKVVSFLPTDVASIAEKATWKYKDKGYNAKLDPAINAFEWNQYALGMRLLRPALKSPNKAIVEDALKLYTQIKTEGEQWKADADQAAAEDPIKAFTLYSRVAEVFDKDELGKSVADPLKKLKTNKAVKDEMAARQMYEQVSAAMSKVTEAQKGQVAQFCATIAKRYPETPTGKKAAALVTELTGSSAAAPARALPAGVAGPLAAGER